MQIQVTQKHIDEGLKNSCRHCPNALAISEQVHIDNCSMEVFHTDVQFYFHNEIYHRNRMKTFLLPTLAKDFILMFDASKIVKPFSFDLNIPKEWYKECNI